MSANHHTRVLRAAARRAFDEMEPRLAKLLEPILAQAGVEAARNFEARATDHLTAAARAHDRLLLASLGPEAAPTLRALRLTAAAPTPNSTMVCLKPRPEEAAAIADPDGEPADVLHITLMYLGEVEGPLEPVAEALRKVAANHAPLVGEVAGYGQFPKAEPGAVGILLPDVPGLVELRCAAAEALTEAGVEYARNHGFLAHVTVDAPAESGEAEMMNAKAGMPLHFDDILIVRGDTEVIPLPLIGRPPLTAAADWTSPANSELVDADALVSRLRGVTDPVRQAAVANIMTAGLAEAGLSFDATNPLAGKMLAGSATDVTDIAETTRSNVRRIVKASYEQGLTIPDTAKAIRGGMDEAAGERATVIARTEMAQVVNGASLAATRIVSQATGTAYTKVWMTADGAKYPRHELYDGLDGQAVPLDARFDVGGAQLMHPGDPDGPPEEVCSCRCTLSYTEVASG